MAQNCRAGSGRQNDGADRLKASGRHRQIEMDVGFPKCSGPDSSSATTPPNVAKRQGFSQSSFAIGTEISIDGYQAIDGSNHVNGSIVFKDGKKIGGYDCFAPGTVCFTPLDSKGNRIQ